jgi:hypothetical protein
MKKAPQVQKATPKEKARIETRVSTSLIPETLIQAMLHYSHILTLPPCPYHLSYRPKRNINSNHIPLIRIQATPITIHTVRLIPRFQPLPPRSINFPSVSSVRKGSLQLLPARRAAAIFCARTALTTLISSCILPQTTHFT